MAIDHLSTSRVLVVDDKPLEAIPILKALGEIGVGCVYVKGDKEEELPSKPVPGIRLVFLDMRLDEGGSQKTVLSKTIGVLKRCVPETTMPLVVICWTRHKDDIDIFREMAARDIPGLKKGFIVGMPKPSSKDPMKWKNLLKEIRQILDEYDAVRLVWQWESVLHEAATEASQTLAEVSTHMVNDENEKVSNWQDAMFEVCRELVKAEVGKTGNKKTVSNALFRTMNELAVDRIQHSVLKNPVSCVDKLIPKRDSALGLEVISRLNHMIIVEPVKKGDKSIRPGNIYLKLSKESTKCLFQKLSINHKQVFDSIAHKKKLDDNIFPILIEASPACDYVQDKRPVCTFIAGFIIPVEEAWGNLQGEHLHFLGPMLFPDKKGARQIVLSKRHMYARTLRQNDISNCPVFRLRSNVLTDLQVKLAAYKSRPGIVALEYRKNITNGSSSAI